MFRFHGGLGSVFGLFCIGRRAKREEQALRSLPGEQPNARPKREHRRVALQQPVCYIGVDCNGVQRCRWCLSKTRHMIDPVC